MYLCAQRVQDPDGSRPLVGQCYLHPSAVHPERLNDVRWVAQQDPGKFIAAMTSGRGGGRAVLSFLDLSGPDSMTRAQIEATLRDYRKALQTGLREPYRSPLAGTELYVGASIAFDERVTEFDTLSTVIEDLFQLAEGVVTPSRGLTIWASREDERTVMRWDDTSRDRIRAEVSEWLVPTFSIDDATRSDFESTFGSIYPVALDALFPLGRERLREFGGAKILDARTRSTLWVTEES